MNGLAHFHLYYCIVDRKCKIKVTRKESLGGMSRSVCSRNPTRRSQVASLLEYGIAFLAICTARFKVVLRGLRDFL